MEEEVNTLEQANVLEEFKEVDEVKAIISNLPNIAGNQVAIERSTERFICIIDLYQEQPHLLDPHLEPLLSQLLDTIKNNETSTEVLHLAFQLLYFITKTRGYKIIVRLMPHEVADLEPVLDMLEKQDPLDCNTWMTRYMLLLWLSMVSMIPFDMCRLDSTVSDMAMRRKKNTMDRIMDVGRTYLAVSDKCRDAASYMLSHFMTRIDVKAKKLPEFLDSVLVTLKKSNQQTVTEIPKVLGYLRTLHLLFKFGKREDLVPFAPTILRVLMDPLLNIKDSDNTAVRKLAIKLIQRLGLTFLKARIASWRYQRGSRSLADNLANSQTSAAPMENGTDTEEDYEIPDDVEDVIEELLTGLKDNDTVVRWSAAKGIGRMLGRLPKELADEVVGSIMELFTITETNTAWHGGCLALAELGRRGLLLPQRLPDVIPVIIKALVYDEKKGNFSVGAHVRDAACYVCWSFARAYDPAEIKPHVQKVASALVIVSVFDREVNVRRAASAAFQENVGRQGQFPHGIDILTTCDYFAVANRSFCYLSLSVYIAQFPEYTKALIDHLVNLKISHWDKSVRQLAAEALHNLTPSDPDYMSKHIVPMLVSMATGIDLTLRHGAILSIAFIVHALAELKHFEKGAVEMLLGTETMLGIENITSKLHQAKMFRGVGGELMSEAVCCLIKKLSLSHIQFHNKPIIDLWQDFLDVTLQRLETNVQHAAVDAIPAFITEYYTSETGQVEKTLQDSILGRYLSQLECQVVSTCCGYILALGVMPKAFVMGQFDKLLSGLIRTSKIAGSEWVEARRDSITSLTNLCLTMGVNIDGHPCDCVCAENIPALYEALFLAIEDYTLDRRGDVGAWVRNASMTALHDITSMLVTVDASLVSCDVVRRMFCAIVQQACEKIDHTRAHAGKVFSDLLYHRPAIENIPRRDQLIEIFPESEIGSINWLVPAETFPRFTQLLSLDCYLYNVLLGLTVSVGGLTESLVKHSAASLLDYLKTILDNRPKLEEFSYTLIKIMKNYQKVVRITLPAMKMIEQLQCNGCFTTMAEEIHPFGMDLFLVCKEEISQSGNVQLLLASIDVFCGLLQFTGEVMKKVLSQLMIFLCHKYPKMRRTAANKLYESMLTYDYLVDEENLDEVLTILSETLWDKPVSEIRPLRNKLCDLFQIPKPVAKLIQLLELLLKPVAVEEPRPFFKPFPLTNISVPYKVGISDKSID